MFQRNGYAEQVWKISSAKKPHRNAKKPLFKIEYEKWKNPLNIKMNK